jgi:hypothetical protein
MNTGAVRADFMVDKMALTEVWILWWIKWQCTCVDFMVDKMAVHMCGFYGG